MLAPTFNDGHTVGVEKEFYVVDDSGSTYCQRMLEHRIIDRMWDQMDTYDQSLGPKCLKDGSGPLEVTTRPCTDLWQLTRDIKNTYGIAKGVADEQGYHTLSVGSRPGREDDHAALHVHLGYRDEDEARYVFTEVQKHVPDIMALSANSPSLGGRTKDVRANNTTYGQRFDAYDDTGVKSVIYVREHTLEVRCMDTQGSAVEDAAIAAYVFGITEKAKDEYRTLKGEQAGTVLDRDEVERNYQQAIDKGMEALFKLNGENVPVSEVAANTFDMIAPYLDTYNCPTNVINVLQNKIRTGRSGADDVIDLFRQVEAEHGTDALVGVEMYRKLSDRDWEGG